jgi:hypothetical protein
MQSEERRGFCVPSAKEGMHGQASLPEVLERVVIDFNGTDVLAKFVRKTLMYEVQGVHAELVRNTVDLTK